LIFCVAEKFGSCTCTKYGHQYSCTCDNTDDCAHSQVYGGKSIAILLKLIWKFVRCLSSYRPRPRAGYFFTELIMRGRFCWISVTSRNRRHKSTVFFLAPVWYVCLANLGPDSCGTVLIYADSLLFMFLFYFILLASVSAVCLDVFQSTHCIVRSYCFFLCFSTC